MKLSSDFINIITTKRGVFNLQSSFKIFAGSSSQELVASICKSLNVEPGKVVKHKFPNDETYVEIKEDIYNREVFVVQTSCPPVDNNLMELFIMIDALRSSGASKITAIIPHFPYVRANQRFSDNISITTRLVTDLLKTSGVDRILTVDLISNQIECVSPIITNLRSNKIIENCIKSLEFDFNQTVIAACDILDIEKTVKMGEKLGIPFIGLTHRQRNNTTGEKKWETICSSVVDKNVIIYANEIESGDSLCASAENMLSMGARTVIGIGVHAVFNSSTINKIENSAINNVIVTDTIYIPDLGNGKISIISIAPIISETIKKCISI